MPRVFFLSVAFVALSVALVVVDARAQNGDRNGNRDGDRTQRIETAALETRGAAGRQSGFFDLRDTFDRDGDGRLIQAEIDATRADQLARFDSDQSGSLTLDEYEALWVEAMRQRMIRRFQRHDLDGDGVVTTEEYQHGTRNLVEWRDRTGDGVLAIEDARARPENGRGRRDGRRPRAANN